ncbi:MAG: hypothetical protein MR004_02080 [Clostridiales bacterium]|nr:hypothetical protein [Clostridiales bacterium]MDY4036099.1 hypothetical protein [Candidatus Pseudoscilispira sp.]
MREGGCQATALYQRMAVEWDETATGLWYVSLEASFETVCAGALWLRSLQAAEAGESAPAADTPAAGKTGSVPPESRAVLLAAVDMLCAAGILTEEEDAAKRTRIETKH